MNLIAYVTPYDAKDNTYFISDKFSHPNVICIPPPPPSPLLGNTSLSACTVEKDEQIEVQVRKWSRKRRY